MIGNASANTATIELPETEPLPSPVAAHHEPVPAYRGTRLLESGCFVAVGVVDGDAFRVAGELPIRLDLARHSPTGFDWAGPGVGSAQLALALLAHHFAQLRAPDADGRALEWYQLFKAAVVAHLPREGWVLTAPRIDAALRRLSHTRPGVERGD